MRDEDVCTDGHGDLPDQVKRDAPCTRRILRYAAQPPAL